MSWNCRFAFVFAVTAAAGCARVSSPLTDNLGGSGVDLAMPSSAPDFGDDNGPADMATRPGADLATPAQPSDLAMAADLTTAAADLATPPDLVVTSSCHLVINEIQTQTTQAASEEFVEIYNPCTSAVSVASFKLGYRAATNTSPASSADSATLYTFSGSLGAGAYFVLGGSSFGGTKNGSLSSGLATSGAVALRDASGAIVDSVAYGTVTAGNAFIETAPAPLPPTSASPGSSIERLPNGADTDDNSHDFQAASTATPGAANH